MRKKRVHASDRLRRIEDELHLAALLRDSVVAGNGDLTERLAVARQSIAVDGVVGNIGEQRYAGCRQNHAQRKFFQEASGSRA